MFTVNCKQWLHEKFSVKKIIIASAIWVLCQWWSIIMKCHLDWLIEMLYFRICLYFAILFVYADGKNIIGCDDLKNVFTKISAINHYLMVNIRPEHVVEDDHHQQQCYYQQSKCKIAKLFPFFSFNRKLPISRILYFIYLINVYYNSVMETPILEMFVITWFTWNRNLEQKIESKQQIIISIANRLTVLFPTFINKRPGKHWYWQFSWNIIGNFDHFSLGSIMKTIIMNPNGHHNTNFAIFDLAAHPIRHHFESVCRQISKIVCV